MVELAFLGRLRGELSGSGARVARPALPGSQCVASPRGRNACVRRTCGSPAPASRSFGCNGRRWRDSAYGGRQTRVRIRHPEYQSA